MFSIIDPTTDSVAVPFIYLNLAHFFIIRGALFVNNLMNIPGSLPTYIVAGLANVMQLKSSHQTVVGSIINAFFQVIPYSSFVMPSWLLQMMTQPIRSVCQNNNFAVKLHQLLYFRQNVNKDMRGKSSTTSWLQIVMLHLHSMLPTCCTANQSNGY